MQIPLIDCDAMQRSEAQIAADIDSALADIGFMAVTRLGVTDAAVETLFQTSQRFFAGNAESKARCAYTAALENFGYQGMRVEALDPERPADLKETFTMRNLTANSIPNERWPDTAFRDAVRDFFDEAMQSAKRLQRLLALALDVSQEFFVQCHGGENITLRLLRYPPVPLESIDEAQMGAGAHTDYGMLTLLFQDDVGGLQVQADNEVWIDVQPQPGTIIINSGDLLERWSNGRYRSTRHRVLPQSTQRDRYSIALFVDPDSQTEVSVLQSCINESNPPRYAATTAGKHLQEKIEATHRK